MNSSLKAFLCDIAYSPVGDKVATLFGMQRFWTESHVRSMKKAFLVEAKKEYQKGDAVGTFEDYKQALEKHWVTYREYAYQYEFYNKNEEERNEYVSRLRMAYFYRRYTPGSAKAVFRNKTRFLQTYKKYIHRQWLYAPEASFEDFQQLVSNYDCIIIFGY